MPVSQAAVLASRGDRRTHDPVAALRLHRRDRRLRRRARVRRHLPADPAQPLPGAAPGGHRPALLRHGRLPAEDSYGTCLVISPDPKQLFDAFAAGLRSRYGRLPLAGFPRITRPRRRKNADGFTGFSLVDPGGNWIRVTGGQRDDDTPSGSGAAGPCPGRRRRPRRLARRRGPGGEDPRRRRPAARPTTQPTVELLEALAYLLELAIRRRDARGRARGAGPHRRPRTDRRRPDGGGGCARVGGGAAGARQGTSTRTGRHP